MPIPASPIKLYQVLPQESWAAAPLCLLLANRQPFLVADYPLPFLVALELAPEAEALYAELTAGRCAT